ncbi:unnamed protein product [Prorocentrum cordatum]|uniref:Endonuclease/exonuclease/phosphatase domain-containing protein n=1 Tax=Prorocentrum cordatum TaxID=2364126 RepID=A0ABN9SJ80_9DINO|nr:unnamed protein product [Polarella glacialis]
MRRVLDRQTGGVETGQFTLLALLTPVLGGKVTPVQQVLNMLSEMKTKGEKMMDEEQKIYAEYSEWADDKTKELGYSIKTEEALIEKLTAFIEDSEGKSAALKLPRDVSAFWSDGTSHQAGVGVLIRHSFLLNFNPCSEEDWVEIVPGRVAVLRLRSPHGALDIVSVYLSTGPSQGAPQERPECFRRMSQHLRPADKVLTVVACDFNFVTDARDRVTKSTGEWSGAGDARNAADFKQLLGDIFEFHELEQPSFPHECALARSRLDRPLPTSPVDGPAWARRVKLECQDRHRTEDFPGSAFRRPILPQLAIRTVTLNTHQHSQGPAGEEHMLTKLKRLLPDASTSLNALVDVNGRIADDPGEMGTVCLGQMISLTIWKVFGSFGNWGVEVLHGAMVDLMRDREFNRRALCCLPEKPTGVDTDRGEYFEASAARPLAIVSTDNMLWHVVGVDYEATTASLTAEHGGMVLFGFKAAFPSESKEYVLGVLSFLGVLRQCMNLEAPLDSVLALEAQALRLAAEGPRHWIMPRDCWYLKGLHGEARSFTSLRIMALAAQARAAACGLVRRRFGY